jgi:hypothetical protein
MAKRQSEVHTHTEDGISYQIEIMPCDPGNYVGRWTCQTCRCNGGSSSTFRSTDETLMQTKLNLSAHHVNTHPKTA